MGIRHLIENDTVEVIVDGQFALEELLEGFRQMLADEKLPSRALILINVTESKILPPSQVIEQIATLLGTKRDRLGNRLAVLVSHTVRFGIARQLGAFLENSDINAQPFYDRKTAIEWLQCK